MRVLTILPALERMLRIKLHLRHPAERPSPYSFSWESKQSKVEENLMNFEELIILGLLLKILHLVGEYLGVGMKSSSFQDYNREDEIIGI